MSSSTQHGTSCVTLVPLFAGLTPAQQREVAAHAHPIRRRRGEQIHRAGEAVSHLLVVHRGRVKITHLAATGQERLIRVLEPGDFAGEVSFVTGSRPEDYATALTDVELCSFRHEDLEALVRQYPEIGLRMLHTITSRLERAEHRLAELSSTDVEGRLAAYLLEQHGHRVEEGMRVHLPLPKKDIASLLGTTPETLSRKLALFADAGLVSVRGRDVVLLDVDALERRAAPA